MDDSNKLPLKRVELSLSKFNEVAIPHHLDLLRQHKANIIKYETEGQWSRVRVEQTHARRVAAQLRSLLAELESLRHQVRTEDLQSFDKLTQHSRELTLKAIMDYLESSPMRIAADNEKTPPVSGSVISTDSIGLVAHGYAPADSTEDIPQLQLELDEETQLQMERASVQEREATLRGWADLQEEVRELHRTWSIIHTAATRQRAQVESITTNVETATENVELARVSLSQAERIRAGAYGLGGAALGAALGGPLGLALGTKVAAFAALAGSALGYCAATLLGTRRQHQLGQEKHD